jgi:ferredoxin, 2Fe-2S
MAKITHVDWGGRSTTVDVANGWSLMQGADSNGVEGIVGECGGSCPCATYHCCVDEERLAELPPRDDNQFVMLDLAAAEVPQRPPYLPAQGVAGDRGARRPPAGNATVRETA